MTFQTGNPLCRHPTCGVVHYRGGGSALSCRFENPFVDHTIPNNKDYYIETHLHIGQHVQNSKKGQDRTIITSGGPGIGHSGCCGLTIGYNLRDGTLHVEDENWTGGHHQKSHAFVMMADMAVVVVHHVAVYCCIIVW